MATLYKFNIIDKFMPNRGQYVHFGMFILTLIAYILLIIFSNQQTQNNNLIIASYCLLFLPMLFFLIKSTKRKGDVRNYNQNYNFDDDTDY